MTDPTTPDLPLSPEATSRGAALAISREVLRSGGGFHKTEVDAFDLVAVAHYIVTGEHPAIEPVDDADADATLRVTVNNYGTASAEEAADRVQKALGLPDDVIGEFHSGGCDPAGACCGGPDLTDMLIREGIELFPGETEQDAIERAFASDAERAVAASTGCCGGACTSGILMIPETLVVPESVGMKRAAAIVTEAQRNADAKTEHGYGAVHRPVEDLERIAAERLAASPESVTVSTVDPAEVDAARARLASCLNGVGTYHHFPSAEDIRLVLAAHNELLGALTELR